MSAEIERLEIDSNKLTFTARACGPVHGRPVIFLHGFPETSWCFRPQLSVLGSAGYRAVALDQRGYSPRARPLGVAAYAIGNLVSDVLGIADTMEMEKFDLVGHDWGGLIAWVLAARYSERVRSLSVISTPHPDAIRSALLEGDPDQTRNVGYIEMFRQPELAERLLLGTARDGSGIKALFDGSGVDPMIVNEYVSCLLEPGALTAAINWYRAMEGSDIDGLAPIVMPTLYIWSTDDPGFGRNAARASAERVVGRFRFEVLEGVNHWIPETAPDELTRLVLEHLDSV